ncbi:hypothetical protein ACTXT7_013428 [Hymenolepis weldensis]
MPPPSYFEVLISVPSWIVPKLSTICFWTKRSRQRRNRKKRVNMAASAAADINIPGSPPLSQVDLEEGISTVDSPRSKMTPSLDANSIEGLKSTAAEPSLEPSAPPESVDTNEPVIATDSDIDDNDSESEEEEEPRELRQGQVLWIRGLSRLQTQILASRWSAVYPSWSVYWQVLLLVDKVDSLAYFQAFSDNVLGSFQRQCLENFSIMQLDRHSEVRESVRDFTRRRISSVGFSTPNVNLARHSLQLRRHVSQPDGIGANHHLHPHNSNENHRHRLHQHHSTGRFSHGCLNDI